MASLLSMWFGRFGGWIYTHCARLAVAVTRTHNSRSGSDKLFHFTIIKCLPIVWAGDERQRRVRKLERDKSKISEINKSSAFVLLYYILFIHHEAPSERPNLSLIMCHAHLRQRAARRHNTFYIYTIFLWSFNLKKSTYLKIYANLIYTEFFSLLHRFFFHRIGWMWIIAKWMKWHDEGS